MSTNLKELQEDGQPEEKYKFNADINSLMRLIVENFYSNKDIFLRELISNASDALDKLRHRSILDHSILNAESPLQISIIPNKVSNTLTIEDTGIGMSKEDLINNLGTVAKSGTRAFIGALKEKGNDKDTKGLIGRFGVGFYSSFLVAHTVEVFSQHPDKPGPHVWRSAEGTSNFTIEPCKDFESSLVRGTRIVLHLKDHATEYLDDLKLRQIVQKHSAFVRFPIRFLAEKEKEVEDEDDTKIKIEEIGIDDKGNEITIEDDTEDKDNKKKKKKKNQS